jgi:Zn-dependent protease with chaperone function
MKYYSKNNIIYGVIVILFYLLITYLVFKNTRYFALAIIIQITFVALAVSPVGSSILLFMFGARPIRIEQEQERLFPLFEEVYNDVKNTYSSVGSNVRLYIEDNMAVNAFAIGSSSIVVTKGALIELDDEELKGILSHEFSHLVHGDTTLLLLLLVGNIMFMIVYGVAKFVRLTFKIMGEDKGALKGAISVLNGFVGLIMFIFGAIILANGRTNEYLADKFAYEVGNGQELLEALYILNEMDLSGKQSIMDKIKSSHPNLPNRISRLETMVNE